jgi:hypothetical protein
MIAQQSLYVTFAESHGPSTAAQEGGRGTSGRFHDCCGAGPCSGKNQQLRAGGAPGARTPNPRIKRGPLGRPERPACTNVPRIRPGCTDCTVAPPALVPRVIPRNTRHARPCPSPKRSRVAISWPVRRRARSGRTCTSASAGPPDGCGVVCWPIAAHRQCLDPSVGPTIGLADAAGRTVLTTYSATIPASLA